MQVAVAQLNLTVGALQENAQRLLAAWHSATLANASVVLTPMLSLCGYAPEDLLLRRAFLADCAQTLMALAAEIQHGALLVGFPEWDEGRCYNAMALLRRGKVQKCYRKATLVGNEARYFAAGDQPLLFNENGIRFAVLIADDLTQVRSKRSIREADAQCALVANHGAYRIGDETEQPERLARAVKALKLPTIIANPVGGQDAQVFMGASMAFSGAGERAQELPPWSEALAQVTVKKSGIVLRSNFNTSDQDYHIYQALTLALRDYVRKNRIGRVVLGLSGGIDSALTCALAVDALGADKVHSVQLASPYTSELSLQLAAEMAQLAGVQHDVIYLEPLMSLVEKSLSPNLGSSLNDLTAQNIQARLRGLLLMAYANQTNALLLATGNKSEAAAGYATLYGDMAGGFAPIKDLCKDRVYRLARYRNQLGRMIPEQILVRAPSAELKPNQTDQDTLPPYPLFDQVIEAAVEQGATASEIIAGGVPAKVVATSLNLLAGSEYKRRQAALGPCITRCAFGTDDWRYPVTSHWRENAFQAKEKAK